MNSNQITPNDKLDSLKFLSQTHRNLFENRIKRTWRYVLSTLTFYVLSVGAKFSTTKVDLPLNSCLFKVLIWVIFLGLACFAAFSLWREGQADDFNRDLAEKAENEIIKIIENGGKDSMLPDESKNKHPNQFHWLWQVAIIFFFGFFSAVLITMT